jgi:hypothetical protein
MIKSYDGLRYLSTFEERFEYLRLKGTVGQTTFGFERYLNQSFYRSREWKHIRNEIMLRDSGCDLGICDREIRGQLLIHHINPVTLEDIEDGADCIFDSNNLITTSLATHNAIHYGDISQVPQLPKERSKYDTRLW